MAFVVKVAWFLPLLVCFLGNQMGFEKVFDDLTFKRMVALRKMIYSPVDCSLSYCF